MQESRSVFELLERRVRGREVVHVRLFLRTLQIYFAADVGESRRLELWCEPSWNLRNSTGVITGSGAIEGPSAFDDEDDVARATATITDASLRARVLVGQTLEDLQFDPLTYALCAKFSGAFVVSTFVDDPNLRTSWVLRDPRQSLNVAAFPHGMTVGTRGPEG